MLPSSLSFFLFLSISYFPPILQTFPPRIIAPGGRSAHKNTLVTPLGYISLFRRLVIPKACYSEQSIRFDISNLYPNPNPKTWGEWEPRSTIDDTIFSLAFFRYLVQYHRISLAKKMLLLSVCCGGQMVSYCKIHVTAGLNSPLFTIKILDKILPEQLQPTFILGHHSVPSFIQLAFRYQYNVYFWQRALPFKGGFIIGSTRGYYINFVKLHAQGKCTASHMFYL